MALRGPQTRHSFAVNHTKRNLNRFCILSFLCYKNPLEAEATSHISISLMEVPNRHSRNNLNAAVFCFFFKDSSAKTGFYPFLYRGCLWKSDDGHILNTCIPNKIPFVQVAFRPKLRPMLTLGGVPSSPLTVRTWTSPPHCTPGLLQQISNRSTCLVSLLVTTRVTFPTS